MRDWQSEREDYLAGGNSDVSCTSGCLALLGVLVLVALIGSAVIYYSLTYQLSK